MRIQLLMRACRLHIASSVQRRSIMGYFRRMAQSLGLLHDRIHTLRQRLTALPLWSDVMLGHGRRDRLRSASIAELS